MGLLPTITKPDISGWFSPKSLATNFADSPCKNTVMAIVRKTKALIDSPPFTPRSVNKIENKEATEAATIPLGAHHDKNAFCRQEKPLFHVLTITLSGRTTNIKKRTVFTPSHPKAKILGMERFADSKINNTETIKVTS